MTWIFIRCPGCYSRRMVLLEACQRFGFPVCHSWLCPESDTVRLDTRA